MSRVGWWEQVRLDGAATLHREAGGHALRLSWQEVYSPRSVSLGKQLIVAAVLIVGVAVLLPLFVAGLSTGIGELAGYTCWAPMAVPVLMLPGLATLWFGRRQRGHGLTIDSAGLAVDGGPKLTWDQVQDVVVEDLTPNAPGGLKIPVQARGAYGNAQEGALRVDVGPGQRRWGVSVVTGVGSQVVAHGILEHEAHAIAESIHAHRPAALSEKDPLAEAALRALMGKAEKS